MCWGKDLTSLETASKKIYIQFLPEQASVLLTMNDRYENSNKMISLNNEANTAVNIKIVKDSFKNMPDTFWIYKEVSLQQPVIVTINDFKAVDDCNYCYYYANIISIKKTNNIGKTVSEKEGCNRYLFEDNYIAQSADDYVNLCSEPNGKSTIIKNLPNNTIVTQIKTLNNWYLVTVPTEKIPKAIFTEAKKFQLIKYNLYGDKTC